MPLPGLRSSALIAATGLAMAVPCAAAGGTATDLGVTARYAPSHWSAAPLADLVGTQPRPDADILVRSGWFYRVHGQDDREHAFPPPTSETWTGSRAEIRWSDVDGKGFEVREYVSVIDDERPAGRLFSQLVLYNHTRFPLDVTVLHYLDASAEGTAEGDLGARENGVLTVAEAPGSEIRYRPLAEPRHWMVRARPEIEELLDDGAPTDLSDDGLPFGPGDWTAAYQWDLSLMPEGGNSYWPSFAGVEVSSRAPARVKGDFFDDSFPDLVLWKAGETMQIWDMLRTERRSTLYLSGETRQPVALDDFTGDGRAELVLVDQDTRQVYFLAFGAAAAAPLEGSAPLSANWEVAATADFDHDGWVDILWSNVTSHRLVIWKMKGIEKTGHLLPSPDRAPLGNWRVVAAQDFDGDGNADLLWHNLDSGRLVVWTMDAEVTRIAGQFTEPARASSLAWVPVGAGDFGRGASGPWGSTDVVWRNTTTGRLVVWHMDFAGRRTSGVFTSPDGPGDPGWRVLAPR